jgi:nucleotide-binding universal stress UspA family protein
MSRAHEKIEEKESEMILPIKKILCPTDFSEPAYEGLKAGSELAKFFSEELILVHVISTAQILPASYEPATAILPQILKELEESAQKSLQQTAQNEIFKDIKVRTLLLQGGPAEEIVRAAEEEVADLIVIATHGQSGWKKFISGSVTERVVRLADRPVLTIHAPTSEE